MYSYYDEMQASALQLWTRVQELQIKASVLQILARAQEAKANSNVTLLAEVSVSRVLGVFGLGVLVAFLSWAVYMVYFHPLAKYPGPFLAKFTHAYAAYHAFKQDIHLDMWRCHEKYGDFVRYGPDRMLINTAAGLKDIYGINKNVTKSQGYNTMIHRVPSVLTIRNKKEHSDRRRLIGEGLSDAAIRRYEPVILGHVDRMCDILVDGEKGEKEQQQQQQQQQSRSETWSVPRNMAKFCNYLAFDIMSDVVFGMKYDLLGNPKYRFLPDAIAGSNVRTTVLLYLPGLVWGRLDKKLFPACIKARNAFLYFMGKLLHERLKTASTLSSRTTTDTSSLAGKRDVFSALAKSINNTTTKNSQTLTPEQLSADSTTLVIAGSDTTATALSSIFFYLAHNPASYALAVREVRSTFASKAAITLGPLLNSCVYLRACIDEAMRITPPIGASLFREAGKGGVRVDGHWFPEGVDVGTSIYSLQHKKEYFPRPHRFEPERWIISSSEDNLSSALATTTTAEQHSLALSALTPFSIGQRACVGKSLAIAELMLAFATILYTLDFALAEGEQGEVGGGKENGAPLGRRNPEEFQLYHGGITSEKNGPMITFSRRKIE